MNPTPTEPPSASSAPASDGPRPLRRSRVRGGLALLGQGLLATVLALIVAEVALRGMGRGVPRNTPAPEGDLIQQRIPEDVAPGVGHALRAGAESRTSVPSLEGGDPHVVVHAINSHGFRDREYLLEKPPGTVRIAVLGDSVTYGTGIPLVGTLPKVLERWFAEHLPQPRVEVLNFGVPATNTGQQVAYLRWKVLEWKPDIVLICTTIVDASGSGIEPAPAAPPTWEISAITSLGLLSGVGAEDLPHHTPAQRRMAALRRTSVLADFLAFNAYRVLYGRVQARNYHRDWVEGSPGWNSVCGALEMARRAGNQNDFELWVAMYPSLVDLGPDYPFLAEAQRLGAFCEERGIPFLHLLEPLYGRDGAQLQAHAHDRHPSPLANQLVGEWLAPRLAASASLGGGLTADLSNDAARDGAPGDGVHFRPGTAIAVDSPGR